MQVLLVLAHPNDDSLSHAIAQRAQAALQAAGHGVDLLDLYAIGFTAAMSAEDHRAYHSDEPIVDPMVAAHAELVRACDAMVFVYPTWWSAQPAILKGWLERVMVPGVAFVFNAKGKVRPGLTNVRRIVGISIYGSPKLYVKFVNDNGRRTLMRAMRLNTGARTRTAWLGLYAIDTATDAKRAAFLDRVERKMRAL
jgi:putative NADPH-quinone reductase